jgi:hypothetical protein
LNDPYASRSHVWVEERAEGRVLLKNVSQERPRELADGTRLAHGEACEVAIPLRLTAGSTLIEVEDGGGHSHPNRVFSTLDRTMPTAGMTLASLGASPDPAQLAC